MKPAPPVTNNIDAVPRPTSVADPEARNPIQRDVCANFGFAAPVADPPLPQPGARCNRTTPVG
jgi:hypothetical protein